MERGEDNVRDIRRVERIGGIRMPLGTMSLVELQTLRSSCQARVDDARTDLMIVEDAIALRSQPDGGSAA